MAQILRPNSPISTTREEREFIHSRTIPELLEITAHGKERLKAVSCQRLFKISWRENRAVEVTKEGAVPILLKVLKSTNSAHLRYRIIKVLRALSHGSQDARNEIIEGKGLKTLVEVLTKLRNKIKTSNLFSSISFSHSSSSSSSSSSSHSLSSITPSNACISLLPVAENAIVVITNLSRSETIRPSLVNSKIPKLLLKFVELIDPNIRITERVYARSLNGLYFLTLDPKGREMMDGSKVLELLTDQQLKCEDLYLKTFVVLVLTNIIGEERNHKLFVTYDVIELLRLFLEEGLRGDKNMFSLGDVARAVQRLSWNKQNSELISKSRIIFLLMKVLNSKLISEDDKGFAEEALGTLARVRVHKEKISNLDGVNVFAMRMYGVIHNIIHFRLQCEPEKIGTVEYIFVEIVRKLPAELRDIICFMYAAAFLQQ